MLPWRGLRKLYLVGRFSWKLEAKEYPAAKNGKLNSTTSDSKPRISKVDLGYQQVLRDHLNFSYRFVGEDQLTRKAIGELENKSLHSSQADNRQSETIKEALEMLKGRKFIILFVVPLNSLVFKPQVKSRNSTNLLWIWKVLRLQVKASQ